MQLQKMITGTLRANAWYQNNGISIGVCKKGDLAWALVTIEADENGTISLIINNNELKTWGIKLFKEGT